MKIVEWWFQKKKQRNYVLLAVLLTILAILVYIQFFLYADPPEGALRVVRCPQCREQFVRLIKTDVSDPNDPACKCPKCRVQLGYAYKCDTCDYEYTMMADIPAPKSKELKTMGKFQHILDQMKCPNCKSDKTHPISVKNQ